MSTLIDPVVLFIPLGLLWGFIGGYYFYYERNLIAAAIFGSALLLIVLGAWLDI